MNRDRDRLLSDILAEPGEADGRRDALLSRTLRHVRRRRMIRRARRAGSVLLLVSVILLLVWRPPPPQGPEAASRQRPYRLVRTERLGQSAVIETQPFAARSVVASAPSLNIATIVTRPENPGYHEIDDGTLLALAGTNAAVLVRLGPHSAELIFASATTEPHTTN